MVTRAIYAKAWKVFNSWCHSEGRLLKNLTSVLEFLQAGADKGLAVGTLNGGGFGSFFGKIYCLDCKIFLRLQARPNEKLSKMGSFGSFSSIDESFEPLESISLKNLMLKTVFLVALHPHKELVSVTPPFFYPYSQIGLSSKRIQSFCQKWHQPRTILKTLCCQPSVQITRGKKGDNLDIRRTLLYYLEVTKGFRSSDSLFILLAGNKKGH